MPDQEVGTQTDGFPKHKQLKQVIRQYQHEHGKGKQCDIAEETGITRLPVHVADRIDVHQGTDTGDQEQHDGGQPVDVEADMDVKMT